MIYVLAYPQFDTKISLSLATFRKIHEPNRAQLVAPHITLVFGVRNTPVEDIERICRHVATANSAISLEFSMADVSYDPFEKKHKIALLCSVGASPLISLHEQLYDGPHHRELHPDIPYRPHMTVGSNADVSKVERVDVALIGDFPIKAMVKNLSVVSLVGGELHSISSISLGT